MILFTNTTGVIVAGVIALIGIIGILAKYFITKKKEK